MKKTDYIPQGYAGIAVKETLDDFFSASFDPANVILYPRRLSEDFNALAFALLEMKPDDGVASPEMNEQELEQALETLDPRYHAALNRVLDDMALICAQTKSLRIVSHKGYTQNEMDAVVHQYHADGGFKSQLGRVLCCYNSPVTEGIRNEDAISMGDDLYTMRPGAQAFSFRPGDLWRQANWEDGAVKPFIHRAPYTRPGDPPRLLLTAG